MCLHSCYDKMALATLQENLLCRNQSIIQFVSAQNFPFATSQLLGAVSNSQKPANHCTQKSEGKLRLEQSG